MSKTKSSHKVKPESKLAKGDKKKKKVKTAKRRQPAVTYAADESNTTSAPAPPIVACTRSEHALLWSDGVLQQRQSLECLNIPSLKSLTKEARDKLLMMAKTCIILDKCAGHDVTWALPALVKELEGMENLPGGTNTLVMERTIHLLGEF